MKINFKHCLIVFAFSSFILSCDKNNVFTGKDYSEFTINGHTKYGNFTDDTVLKAYTIPCQDNSTLRMYYSDSAAMFGLPASFEIVSYQKAGHLGYHEVYLEVTTTAVDTYLSTGMPGIEYLNYGPNTQWGFDSVVVQHFTSVPQSDFSAVSATFRPL